MRRSSKGQVALEYLVTYGWAFLALLVVVGAMAYFGYLSPAKYLPSRCEFGMQLECIDYQLASDIGPNGAVRLRFRNNFADDIQITDAWIDGATSSLTFVDGNDVIVKGNTSGEIQAQIPDGAGVVLVEDERYSVSVRIEFRRDMANAPRHNVSGEIFATVQ